MIGQTVSHYKILSWLGAGGMGEVFLAEDTKLDRQVALKFLPAATWNDDEAKKRLIREAKAASQLDHPNIVTIHGIEESDSRLFIIMAHVKGSTLDKYIGMNPHSTDDLINLIMQITDGLQHAHDAGVVHRDLKPGNILVDDNGRVRILDFGLARMRGTSRLTQVGSTVGTLCYSPPELIQGDDATPASDIYSLGVVLYQMLTGHLPFESDHEAALLYSILQDEPKSLSNYNPSLSDGLQQVVSRCLNKNTVNRFQSAKELRDVLIKVRTPSVTESSPAQDDPFTVSGFSGRPAIAVLPFDNRSGDAEQEYFAQGLAEDLITRLSLWRAFPVIARNSSFTYVGKNTSVKEIASELGVRYVVQGSVRTSGIRVRVAAQLLDAITGQNVWAQTFDRELIDVFAVQDEISEAIAASLLSDLQRAEYAHVQHRAPESLEAWGLYQRAVGIIYRFTREDMDQARLLLERATTLDPRFATAWARLAETSLWRVIHGWTETPERSIEMALTQARRAVDLDTRDAEAHAVLSFALMTAGDGYAANEEATRGLDVNPSHPLALLFKAYVSHMTGHPPEESIQLVRRSMRLSPRDPVEWVYYDVLAGAYFNAGQFVEGLNAARRLVALWPSYYFGHLWSAMNAVALGELETAQASICEARRLVPELSLKMVRRVLGAMSPDVDRRMMGALNQAGLE